MNDITYAGKHFLTYTVSRHKHSSWELVYCTEKSGRFIFDQSELSYSVGDVVIIPPEMPHQNVSEGGFANIHLNISNSTLSFRAPVIIRDDANHSILHLFGNAHFLFSSEHQHKTELLASYGTLIVRLMESSHSVPHNNGITDQIVQSIVQNYTDANYRLDEVMNAMPYCEDYLCRVFRRETGVTPHRYLTNLRLQSAATMLRSVYSNSSIAEIAQLCGFKNPLYFSRLFKKKYGVAPKEYSSLKQDDAQSPESPRINL